MQDLGREVGQTPPLLGNQDPVHSSSAQTLSRGCRPRAPENSRPRGRLAGAPSSSPHPKEGSAEDALPQAASEARPARLPPKRSDLRILNREPDEADNCYLDGTLETETAAEAAALLPNNACLSATDIETAAIFLRANAWMGGRIPARDSLPSFSRQCGRSETKSCSVCFPFEVGI